MNTVQSPRAATIDETMESATTTTPGSMVLLTRLSRVVYRRASEAVLGMSLKEYMALNNLREQPNVTQQALGDSLHLDANNCVLLLNVLEAGHLAERRRDRIDRRRHIVELTPAGRVAVERADRALESVEDEVLGALSADERAMLHRLLLRALETESAQLKA
jgi:DNA-binding MarR family transcriptional regulator